MSQPTGTGPLISVVTAVRNGRSTILDCLASMRTQQYTHTQHVIVDGASSDGTRELIEAQRRECDAVVSERDTGIYNALNKGIRLCRGDVIGFLHADDMFANGNVLSDIAEVFRDPGVQVVYGDLLYVNRNNTAQPVRYWSTGEFSRQRLSRGWMPPHPTLYVRSSVYARVGTFNEDYRIAADYDSVLRIFSQPDLVTIYIPRILVRMRVGGASNASFGNIIRKSAEDYRALRKNKIGGLMTLACKNLRKLRQFNTCRAANDPVADL